MAYHGVLIPEQIAAMNVDSYNRSVISSASALDNGNVFGLGGKSTTDGESEVFSVVETSSSNIDALWMAYSGDEIVVTDARYKGLDPDPRNFYNAAGKVFSAYRPKVGDIILLTGEGLTGTAESAYAVGSRSFWCIIVECHCNCWFDL